MSKPPQSKKAKTATGKPQQSAPRRPAAAARDSSSSDESDSDDEIGLTADQNVRATVKPIAADAPQLGSKPASTAAASAAKPGSKKRKKGDAAADGDDDDGSDGDDDPNELIDVEFGIYDPRPVDYLTLKMLLKDYVHPAGAGLAKKKSKKKAAAAAAAAAAAEEDGEEEEEEASIAAAAASISADPDFALHELCDALVTQVCAGSMVKGEGTEEPLGFLSALNMSWQAKHARAEADGKPVQWVSQLRSYLLRHTPAQHKATMEAALNDPATALLLQQRLLNVPPQIVPQLHQCLLDDLAWAQTNAIPATPSGGAAASPDAIRAYRSSFKFKQALLVGRMFRPPAGSKRVAKQDVLQSSSQHFISPFASKKKQKQAAAAQARATNASTAAAASAAGGAGALPEWEWLRFEEELYARESTLQFSVPCPYTSEDVAAGRLPQTCVFMLVPFNKIANIVQELHAMAAMS